MTLIELLSPEYHKTMDNQFKFALLLMLLFGYFDTQAQLLEENTEFTRADTLRGSLNNTRSCYDVNYYHLDIEIQPDSQFIIGKNTIRFTALSDFVTMQVDLFENMSFGAVYLKGDTTTLDYKTEGNATFVFLDSPLDSGQVYDLVLEYFGNPVVAERAPWDGGFVWGRDKEGEHWVGVACEGTGASLWWPNKDHLSDEPDSMLISITVPQGLTNVSNGQLRAKTDIGDSLTRFDWFVSYPINNYNVTVNIGKYDYFSETYEGLEGPFQLDYYVKPANFDKAKEHFKQVKPMMECFEQYLGPFPFPRDGFKLVETQYLGMEHQSAIAYGNKYLPGYAGMDYSRIGLEFDYIIIHEAGHEWWGNNVSAADIADLWIHEGFCTYSEALYVECLHGYDKALDYVNAKKPTIENDRPIIGPYGVNEEGSGDMYNKGMLILNTIRHAIDNDTLWFKIIKGLNTDEQFRYQTTNTEEVVHYISRSAEINFNQIFDQYLNYADIPTLVYRFRKKKGKYILEHKWSADVEGFNLEPIISISPGVYVSIPTTTEWQKQELYGWKKKTMGNFEIRTDLMYFNVEKLDAK